MTQDIQVVSETQEQTATLTIKVPVEVIQKDVDARVKKLSKTARVDGFRKGKVPASYIQSQYGVSIQQEVINDTIKNTVFEAISKESLRAIGSPSIDDVKLEDDFLVYRASVELMPTVEVQGLDAIEVERQNAVVSDDDVDAMIESLQKQRQSFEPKEEGVLEEGDEAAFDFKGTLDGEAFDGGSAQNQTLIIGSKRMIEGFEAGMVGMQAGESRTINVTFPENYQAEHLAGRDAQFEITLHAIKAPKLPELDNAFFELFGVKEGGIETLKQEVKKNMERETKAAARAQIKAAAFDALVEKNEFDVPKVLLTQEIARQKQLMANRFAQQMGSKQSIDTSVFPDEMFEEQALRAVRLSILIGKIIEDASIAVDPERVTAFIEEAAQNYESPEEVIDYLSKDKRERANIEAVILEDQVVEHILKDAKVEDKTVNYQDLLAAAQVASMS